jgi:hypothetical protein
MFEHFVGSIGCETFDTLVKQRAVPLIQMSFLVHRSYKTGLPKLFYVILANWLGRQIGYCDRNLLDIRMFYAVRWFSIKVYSSSMQPLV